MSCVTCSCSSFYKRTNLEHFCADSQMEAKPSLAEQILHRPAFCRCECIPTAQAYPARGHTELCRIIRRRHGCCGPGPGLFLAASFLPASRTSPWALFLREERFSHLYPPLPCGIPSSSWRHALSSLIQNPSFPLPSSICCPVSHLPFSRKRTLQSVHFLTSCVLLIYYNLIFAPTIWLISLSLWFQTIF